MCSRCHLIYCCEWGPLKSWTWLSQEHGEWGTWELCCYRTRVKSLVGSAVHKQPLIHREGMAVNPLPHWRSLLSGGLCDWAKVICWQNRSMCENMSWRNPVPKSICVILFMVKGSQGGAVIAVWGGSDITLWASESIGTYFRCIWLPNVSSSFFFHWDRKISCLFWSCQIQSVKVSNSKCQSQPCPMPCQAQSMIYYAHCRLILTSNSCYWWSLMIERKIAEIFQKYFVHLFKLGLVDKLVTIIITI